MDAVYSSKQPLKCSDFPNLKRQIGVAVDQYWEGHWDIEYERVSINTASFGKGVSDPSEITREVEKDTEAVMNHLDTVIAELQEHRARLAKELESIRERTVPKDGKPRQLELV